MPNPVLTEAIDLLANRHDLSVEQSAAVLAEIMGGNASDTRDRRGPDRAAHEGRDGRRDRRPRDHDAAARDPGHDRPRRPHRHRRHRRRAADLQRLDDRGADRGRRRLRGRQARQPLGDRAVGLRRPAGGARRAHRPRAGRGRALHRGGGLRLHVRARPPRRDAARRSRCAGSSRCGRSSTSSARSPTRRAPRARSSASRTRPSCRRSRERWPGWAPDKALVVSSADGLDEMSTAGTTTVVEVDGDEIHSYELAPEDVGLPRSPLRRRRRRHAAAQRRGDAPDLRRRGRPRARPGGAQRRRRDLRRGACRHASRRGVRAAEQALDSGAATEALDTLVALTQQLAPS